MGIRVRVAGLLTALVLLAGCASGAGTAGGDEGFWLRSVAPVDTTPLVWASDDVVHLADVDRLGEPADLEFPTRRRRLLWWASADLVVGMAVHGPGRGDSVGPDDWSALMTCSVSAGTCREYDDSVGAFVQFPAGMGTGFGRELVDRR
jgi:hypothetical protein